MLSSSCLQTYIRFTEACRIIVPEGDNTCTVVEGELTLRLTGNSTDTEDLEEQVRSTICGGMGPTGTYRLVDGRIVRLECDNQVIAPFIDPNVRGETTSTSSIPVYPFIIAALFIVALIAGLLFYRRKHLSRDHQTYDEDGNPMGDGMDSGYDSGYAPPGGSDMMQLEGDDQAGGFDEYGDGLGGGQQQGGQYIEDGYGDGGGYEDDGYDDGYGDGGGFDTIQEEGGGGDNDDWAADYGVNENESAMQNSMDEYSEQYR